MPLPEPPPTVTEQIAAAPAVVAAALDKSPHIVNDWRRIPRFISAKAFAIIGGIQGVWLILDADQRASLPPGTVRIVTIIVAAVGLLGLVIKQKNGPNRDDLGRKNDGSS